MHIQSEAPHEESVFAEFEPNASLSMEEILNVFLTFGHQDS